MHAFDKQAVLDDILTQLRHERDVLFHATKATYEGATHEESKAEDKYDTRGLEASYLAGAQSKRTVEIEQAILAYERLQLRAFTEDSPLALGAIVQLENEEGTRLYFLGPKAGGHKVIQGGQTLVVITPQSPLGRSILGTRVGDALEIEQERGVLEYEIINAW